LYVGPIPDGYEIDHDDTDKTNNYYKNLIAVTPMTNTQKACAKGLMTGFFKKGNSYQKLRKTVGNRYKTVAVRS